MISFSGECPNDLDDPDNGCVVTIGNVPGEKVVYFCNKGFTLNGARKRECEDGGKWSGREPTCDSKYKVISYTLCKISYTQI